MTHQDGLGKGVAGKVIPKCKGLKVCEEWGRRPVGLEGRKSGGEWRREETLQGLVGGGEDLGIYSEQNREPWESLEQETDRI